MKAEVHSRQQTCGKSVKKKKIVYGAYQMGTLLDNALKKSVQPDPSSRLTSDLPWITIYSSIFGFMGF